MPKKGKESTVDKRQDKRIAKLEKVTGAQTTWVEIQSLGQVGTLWSTTAPYVINSMVTGAGPGARLGTEIFDRELDVKLQVNNLAVGAAGDGFCQFRVICFVDREPNGAIVARADLFAHGASDNAAFYSDINPDQRTRFKILYDKSFPLNMGAINPNGGGVGVSTIMKTAQFINFKRKINMKTIYDALSNAGTIADINTNAIYLQVFTPVAATVAYNLNYTLRYDA